MPILCRTSKNEAAPDPSVPAMDLSTTNLDAMSVGCAFFGCGGGGDVIAAQAAHHALATHGPVPVLDLDDLPDDALVLPCADMGAPTIFFEKVANGGEGEALVREMEAVLGRKVDALMPAEIGGSNGITPVVWAARTGLPIVDADGIGRAYPEVNMIALEINGVSISPAVLADERGNTVVVRSCDGPWMERIARAVTVEFGGAAAFACYPMDAVTARRCAVRGSVTAAIAIGEALASPDTDPVDALCAHVGAYDILRGKIVDLDRQLDGGFVTGTVTIEGTGRDHGRDVRVEFQNEFLVAMEKGEPLAMVPDLISLLDASNAYPISTERMRYGMRVAVVGRRAPDIWRSEAGVRLGGPRAFGYDFDYVSLPTLEATGA